MKLVKLEDIKRAQEILRPIIKKTQIIESEEFSRITGGKVFFKPENLQLTGSFKIRGAYNKINSLSDDEKSAGVIASSAGNHAQGVALSATKMGIKSTIVMPEIAPLAKVSATENFGAKVVLHGAVYDDAYTKAREIQEETGATFLHPFDDQYVIAGQGTIGLEILEELSDVDMVLVPIGGGGILAGISTAIKSINPNIQVIGVEAANAACMYCAIKENQVHTINSKATIADGIAVRRAGDLTYEIIKKNVDQIVTVTEDDLARAFLTLLEKGKIVAEGAGVASVAALYNKELDFKGKKILSVITGGNLDINLMERIMNKALILEHRRFTIKVKVSDKSGEMNKLIRILSMLKANILTLDQTMYKSCLGISEQEVKLTLETFNKKHTEEIVERLEKVGYEVK